LSGARLREAQLPFEGTYDSGVQDGVWSIRPDLAENRRQLYRLLYGE
ncbi:MAG: hypothetical protein GX558_09620, partial [Clostridiales bacterium]|nr:hypothetical protein [Clostridiales bacterium]